MRMREGLTLMKVKGGPKGRKSVGGQGDLVEDSLRMIKHYKLLTFALKLPWETGGEPK